MYLYYWFNKLSMKTYSISSKQMIVQVNNNFENFKNILNLYLKNPNGKNIHDLRKSIRRLDSAYYSLPKKFRKNKPIKNYVNHSKDLFKSNSQVRDYDIFLEKINSHNSTNNKNNNLKDQIEQNKKTQLETAKKIAQNLELSDFPQIGTALISDKKVQKRFNKLYDIQDILGEIHDCDATIMFLRQQKKQYPAVKNFINNESTIRNNKYEQFVNQYKNYTQPNISIIN